MGEADEGAFGGGRAREGHVAASGLRFGDDGPETGYCDDGGGPRALSRWALGTVTTTAGGARGGRRCSRSRGGGLGHGRGLLSRSGGRGSLGQRREDLPRARRRMETWPCARRGRPFNPTSGAGRCRGKGWARPPDGTPTAREDVRCGGRPSGHSGTVLKGWVGGGRGARPSPRGRPPRQGTWRGTQLNLIKLFSLASCRCRANQ